LKETIMNDIRGAASSTWGGVIGGTWSRLNRHWKRVLGLCLALSVALITLVFLYSDAINEIPDRWHVPFFNTDPLSTLTSPAQIFEYDRKTQWNAHPIHELIRKADLEHEQLLAKKTVGPAQAAQEYRKRRGRHPPPRFGEWVAFAEAHGSLMVEDMFDRIHHDLNPFWGIDPEKLRAGAAAHPHFVRVRNGTATRSSIEQPFMDSWFDLIQKIATYLPDVDIPINTMDESRVIAPWEQVAENMRGFEASLARQDLGRAPSVKSFPHRLDPPSEPHPGPFDAHPPFWNIARQACSPETEARTLDVDADFSTPPQFPQAHPYGTYLGYVANWTTSQDVCRHPHIRNLHGTFVEPVSLSTCTSLIPIFSGSKLLVNNDILLPPAMYWADQKLFAASENHVPWQEKRNETFWRGTGSGGRNKEDNWTRFQRHRLVSMLNGTQVQMSLDASYRPPTDDGLPHNFPMPNNDLYPLVSAKLDILPDWLRSFSNVAFSWLECFPPVKDYGCSYTGDWYRRGQPVAMERMFLNKFLPDVDGNSFSGRFRAFLLSNSLPIKASIYTEWHESRLIPWRHFVPMDNTFVDLWSILEYFFKNDGDAEKIGVEGRLWAEKVLRKEDMLVYVYRLLLEYARLMGTDREEMGWADDLIP
jgi:hypothetical protein